MKISRSTSINLLITVSSIFLYALIFMATYPSLGPIIATLNVIPAITFGWAFGIRGGLLSGLIVYPVNIFLFWMVGDPAYHDLVGNIIATVAFTLVSIGIGWVRELNVRVYKQADELQAERKLLQEEIVRRTRAEEKSTLEALHDPLTNLPNRRLFFNRLQHAYGWSKRNPENLCAVLFLDLNKFKTVNDNLGHSAGDQLLIQFAGRLRSSVRDIDTVARMGGDEFAILLEAASTPEDVKTIIQRIQVNLARPYELRESTIVSEASIGVVIGIAAYQNLDEILRDADTAMYEAKVSGGNQFRVFKVGMGE